jgi:hypothetical protein
MPPKPVRFEDVVDGTAIDLRTSAALACCDCGLVHLIKVRVVGRRVLVTFTRDERLSAARRRAVRPPYRRCA